MVIYRPRSFEREDRSYLPDSMQWNDTEEPANEINAARMRAKYYGSRYIIHRPLFYHALHNNTRAPNMVQTPAASLANEWTAPQFQLRTLPGRSHRSHRSIEPYIRHQQYMRWGILPIFLLTSLSLASAFSPASVSIYWRFAWPVGCRCGF